MATKLIRRNGQLVREEIPAEAQPQSPAGAVALGASKDSAKMAGTQAQKGAVIQQSADALTLSQAQRTAGPRTQATEQELAATTKATRLSQLGGLGSRVEAKVRQQFQTPMAGAQLQLDEEKLKGYTPEQQELLKQVAAATTPEEREAAIVNLSKSLDTTAPAVQSLLQEMGSSLSQQGQATIGLQQIKMDPALLEEFGGADSIAADIGVSPEELANMTVEDFEAKLQELESNEFSKIEALKAEVASASPIRRQEIIQELRALGATGITGVEKSVDTLQQQIEEADVVTFNGEEYELGDLLENDAISDAIYNAVGSESELEALAQTEPELAEWIRKNKDDLSKIVEDIKEVEGTVAQTTEVIREMSEGVSQGVRDFFGIGSDYMTASELEAKKNELDTGYTADGEAVPGAGAWQASKSNSGVREAINENPGVLNSFTVVDAATGETVPMNSAEVEESYDLATKFREGPDAEIFNDLIPGIKGKFITDPKVRAKVKYYSGILDLLPEDIKSNPELSEFLRESLKNNTLDPALARDLAKDPKSAMEKFTKLKSYSEEKDQFDDIDPTDTNKLLEFITGEAGVDVASINSKFKNASLMANWDESAKQVYNALREFDTNKDGVIDDKDTSALYNKVSGLLSKKGTDKFNGYDMLETVKSNMITGNSGEFNRESRELLAGYNSIMSDGKITKEDLVHLTPDQMNTLTHRGILDVTKVKEALRDNYYSNISSDPAKLAKVAGPINDYFKSVNPNIASFDKYGNVKYRNNYPSNLKEVAEMEATVKEMKNKLRSTSEYDPSYHYLLEVIDDAERQAKDRRRVMEANKPAAANFDDEIYKVKGINT